MKRTAFANRNEQNAGLVERPNIIRRCGIIFGERNRLDLKTRLGFLFLEPNKLQYFMRFVFTTILIAAAAVAGAQSDSAAVYLQKGLEQKSKGRTLEAFKALDKAYAFDKNNKEVTTQLAGTLYDLHRYPQAREKYLQLESMGDHSADTYRKLMELSFNLRVFNEAAKYANLVKIADPSAKTAYYIGKAKYEDENYGEAIKYLDIAAKEDPQNAEVPYMVARSYADMNNYKQAMPYFEKAAEMDPKNTRILYEMGLIYYAMHDDKNSLKYLLLAADKGYKRDNEYLENLAIAYLNNGKSTLR